MDRRAFVNLMASGLVSGTMPAMASGAGERSARANFLFIIADDMTFRAVHSLNNAEIHTPNLDRLVNRGCAFTHCFHQGAWQGAVCVPSRVMLNTGLTAFHAEMGLDKVRSWGQTLGAAGYDTYLCGKWHLDATALQRSFRELGPIAPGFLPSGSASYRSVTGPDPFYSDAVLAPDHKEIPYVEDAAYFRPRLGDEWQPWDESRNGHWLHTDIWLDKPSGTIEHSSVVYADAVIDHLTKSTPKRSNPFFVYLGFNAPHDPCQSPKEYLDLYPQDKIEIPPNFLPEHPFDIVPYLLGRDEALAPSPRTKDAIQLHRREYYAIITHMDHQIGRILDALEQSGQASNTYVILTADHGLAVGEHGLLGKQNLYDCSIRMPLLISGPGIPAGRRVDELVYQHSMFATTCELAGIEVPESSSFPAWRRCCAASRAVCTRQSSVSTWPANVRCERKRIS